MLVEALHALPQRQAQVVALRDVHGLDGAEVADLIGISEGNVRVLLHRGRAALRLRLEDFYRDGRAGRMSGIEIPCDQIVEMVTDYLEDALDPEQRQLFEEHLADCPPCTRYVEQIQVTLADLGTVQERTCPSRRGPSCAAPSAA